MKKIIAMVVGAAGAVVWGDVKMAPDGDVRTPAEALARVRALRAAGAASADEVVTVRVAPGVYHLTEPVTFTAADSRVAFVADGGEAVFDGGREIGPFRAGADGVWEADVPEGVEFEQLWVNGVRATPARSPNAFYYYMAKPYEEDTDPLTGAVADMSKRAFYARPEDVAPLAGMSPDELKRVRVVAWQSWDMGYSPLRSVDVTNGLVTVEGGLSRPCYFWKQTQPRYALENFRAALDAPGEWFLDVAARKVLYIPRAGERLETARAEAAVSAGLVVLAGTPEAPVRDVSFRGIALRHSAHRMPPGGVRNAQSVQNVPDAAVRATSATGFVFADGSVTRTGAHGIWLRDDCHDARIVKTLVEDLGGGGVYFGDTRVVQPPRAASGLRLENCIVRHGGLTFNGAIGVWLGHARDCVVEHNDIGDFRYTGVSMGWTWGYRPTVVRRNRLAFNRIHHIGWGVLSDMGAVYTLGDSEGTEVTGNWIHDVNGYSGAGAPAWGLYTDEGSHGIVFSSNLVERCRDGAVHQHYGKENVFCNNIFATFERNGIWRSRSEDHTTIIVTNNIVYWTNAAASAYWSGGGRGAGPVTNIVFDGNLYWGAHGVASNAFNRGTFAAWQAAGMDARGRIADPLFVDSARGDWRLCAGSPAREMGFVPFDWRAAGVRADDPAWRARAMDADAALPPLVDAPPAPKFQRGAYRQTFETLRRNNGKTLGAFTVSEGKAGAVRIVDGGVAGGKQCVRFTDGPELPLAWQPHIYYACSFTGGTVRVRFAVKGDGREDVQFECRDYHPGNGAAYASGPVVKFTHGAVTAAGQTVARVPARTWCFIEVEMRLDGPQAGTWSCTACATGGQPREVRAALPQGTWFRNLEWTGFISCGRAPAEWWLDDFEIR